MVLSRIGTMLDIFSPGNRARFFGALVLGVLLISHPASSDDAQLGFSTSITISGQGEAKVEASRSATHSVTEGDTLYGIAWRYGMDYRTLASTNNIAVPYTIYPGQLLSLDSESAVAVPAESENPELVPAPIPTTATAAAGASTPAPTTTAASKSTLNAQLGFSTSITISGQIYEAELVPEDEAVEAMDGLRELVETANMELTTQLREDLRFSRGSLSPLADYLNYLYPELDLGAPETLLSIELSETQLDRLLNLYFELLEERLPADSDRHSYLEGMGFSYTDFLARRLSEQLQQIGECFAVKKEGEEFKSILPDLQS